MDKVLELWAKDMVVLPIGEAKEDLGVGLEGNVTADHVVKQDAKGPNCETISCVPPVFDPFGGCINSGS